MGFSRTALLWIKSYLQDRQLQVVSKSSSSNVLGTNLGVPQGSVLGPLLFCLYINDLQIHLPTGVFHLLYADDLQVYIQAPPEEINASMTKLNLISSKVSSWATDISLRLNHKKTKAIYFTTSTFAERLNSLNLQVDMGEGIKISFSEVVKSLGVLLDNKLSWTSQIKSIENKVNRILYTLRFIRHCTTQDLRVKLVQALITPHLDYCNTVFLDMSMTLKLRLQRLSNSGLRYIFGVRRDEHITPYRKKLNWLCVESRRLYFSGIIIYKI